MITIAIQFTFNTTILQIYTTINIRTEKSLLTNMTGWVIDF